MHKSKKQQLREARKKHGKGHLLKRHEVDLGDKGAKLYSAEEAKAEKAKRDKANEPLIVNNSFLKRPTEEEYYWKMIEEKFTPSLQYQRDIMVAQAIRYIMGPSIDMPLDKFERMKKLLFTWIAVKKHPLTGEEDPVRKYTIFNFHGDAFGQYLENREQQHMLLYEPIEDVTLKFDENNKVIGLENKLQYLFDPDHEYEDDYPSEVGKDGE